MTRFPTRRPSLAHRVVTAAHRFTESHPIAAWLVVVAFAGVVMVFGGAK